MISRHVFDSNLQTKVEKDHNQALNIYAATDNFIQIGEPEVSAHSISNLITTHREPIKEVK